MDIIHTGPAPVPDGVTSPYIPMRDGVRLAADLYRPDGPGPFPVVLIRLPYDKDGRYCFMPEIAPRFTESGYAVVVQDVRGKYRSEGVTEFGVHEVADGYDTIDWIVAQDWSDGNVVMWGDSYFGMTQLAAAVSAHPALRAISPRVTGTGLSCVTREPDGFPEPEQMCRRLYLASHYVDRDQYEWQLDPHTRPLSAAFEEFFTELGHRSRDYDHELTAPGDHRGPSVAQLLAAPPVPTMYTIGWYDNCAIWSWHDVNQLLAHPDWQQSTYLRLEGIDHENYRFSNRPIGEHDRYDKSVDARAKLIPQMVDPSIAFFDFWLGRSVTQPEKVTYEICHGSWDTAQAWPPSSAVRSVLHVHALDQTRSGELKDTVPSTAAALVWESDGINLVPSVTANPFAMALEMENLTPTDRTDVAFVTGTPLDDDLVLAGPIELTGWLTSDQNSTDLFTRLLDVAPDGSSTLIARGGIRLSDLRGVSEFRVSLLHAGYKIAAEHRLGLHLATTDFPEYIFNTGNGTDPWEAELAAKTVTRLHTGPQHDLRLTITTMPPFGQVE
ncbi:CocE/NonD family hydrolase [Rhodococcus sp. NPDC056960]|uniref:CocE/NonD family hydrolase n=1 Tax=Rhodococcus sp. NPDC056960 TaxID=3345982 RepID=UPI0036432A24